MKEPTFDSDGYPTQETLDLIENWPHTDWLGLMEFARATWSDYGWFENCSSLIAPHFHEDDDGNYFCCATGGWSGNESIIGALCRNKIFDACCWYASVRGGYHEYHLRP